MHIVVKTFENYILAKFSKIFWFSYFCRYGSFRLQVLNRQVTVRCDNRPEWRPKDMKKIGILSGAVKWENWLIQRTNALI